MALITDLPAASSLASTDLLVIDTGSATKKIAASNAGAGASNAGLVTTGAQTIAGVKTFSSIPKSLESSSNGPGLMMSFSDKSNAVAAQILTVAQDYSARTYLREYSGNSSGMLSYYEQFRLPQADSGRTTNATYEILTTKPSRLNASDATNALDNIGIHRGTVSSKTLTIPAGYRGFLVTADSDQTRVGVFIVYSFSNGAVNLFTLHAASGATITGTTNTLSIVANSGTIAYLLIDMNGMAS